MSIIICKICTNLNTLDSALKPPGAKNCLDTLKKSCKSKWWPPFLLDQENGFKFHSQEFRSIYFKTSELETIQVELLKSQPNFSWVIAPTDCLIHWHLPSIFPKEYIALQCVSTTKYSLLNPKARYRDILWNFPAETKTWSELSHQTCLAL